jgi:hypothetical protein
MARPQVGDGGTASIMKVDENILNKQAQTSDKTWSSSLEDERDSKNSS